MSRYWDDIPQYSQPNAAELKKKSAASRKKEKAKGATSHPVAGWTTTILFLSVAFLGLFGVMTVVIKYLQLLVGLVFKRKHYSFESIEKLSR